MTFERDIKELETDLLGRVPYGVVVNINGIEGFDRTLVCLTREYTNKPLLACVSSDTYEVYLPNTYGLDEVRPYLRPYSDMTEQELREWHELCECDDGDFTGETMYFHTCESFEYLNSIHIDYRNLIARGLALRAPEGMYERKGGEL